MISSVAPTRKSTFYAYLITKIGNRNLNGLIRFQDAANILGFSKNVPYSKPLFWLANSFDVRFYTILQNKRQSWLGAPPHR